MTEEEKLKKDLEKILNTNAKIHSETIEIVMKLRKSGYSDIQIMAIGILTSKFSRQHMGANK